MRLLQGIIVHEKMSTLLKMCKGRNPRPTCIFNASYAHTTHAQQTAFYVGWVQESHSLRNEAALQSGGTTADTSVSFARWQQGKQTVAEVDVVF